MIGNVTSLEPGVKARFESYIQPSCVQDYGTTLCSRGGGRYSLDPKMRSTLTEQKNINNRAAPKYATGFSIASVPLQS